MTPEIIDFTTMSVENVRNFISEIEAHLAKQEQIDVPVTHHFSKSVYAREMTLAKGSLVIGKIHKYQNLNILSQGEASILSIDGAIRVKAPYTFVASPGTKRMIFAHEDLVWTTIHGTDETDVDKIEEEFILTSYDKIDHKEDKWLGSQSE